MKKCNNCGKMFDAVQIINGKEFRNYIRKYCYKCVPYKHSPQAIFNKFGKKFVCKTCNRGFIYTRHSRIDQCAVCYNRLRIRKLKIKIVNLYGNECVVCGWNKFVSALSFHHLDPNKKDINISKLLATSSWSRVKKEAQKCVMVCANCHSGIHSGSIIINAGIRKVIAKNGYHGAALTREWFNAAGVELVTINPEPIKY